MPKLVLTEELDKNEKLDLVESLAESADGLGAVMNAANTVILTEDDGASEQLEQLVDVMDRVRARKIERGEELINESFDQNLDILVSEARKDEQFNDWYVKAKNGAGLRDLTEAGPSGLRASHYKHMIDHCLTTIMVDLQCDFADYTTGDCFQQLPASPCDDSNQIQFCEKYPAAPPEMCCEISDQPATFVNETMERVCWKRPQPCVRSLAYGLHEDVDCIGARAQMRDEMEQMISYWRDRTAERERIATLFGLPACQTCSTNAVQTTWNFNDQECEGYQNPGQGLWTNSLYGKEYNPDPMVSGTCERADEYRKSLKEVWDHMCNWYTNDPVECGLGDYQIMVVNECIVPHFRAMFGAFDREHCVSGACDGKEYRSHGADPEFSDSYKFSRWARQCLVDFFLNNSLTVVDATGTEIVIDPAPNELTAQYRADNTFLISRNWQATFACYSIPQVTRTLNGRQHWHYFDRGYDEMKRIFWGYLYAPQRPWLTTRVFAWDAAVVL